MIKTALLAFGLILSAVSARAAEGGELWSALRDGGVVAMVRHARAPGTGDPAGFRLGDCASQRNLDAAGRSQAVALGARFRQERVPVTEVRSSRWCRAFDTAALAFPEVGLTPDSALDSFFGEREAGPGQTDSVRALVAGWRDRNTALLLVTHQVNITALTGVYPAEGEVVVLRGTAAGVVTVLGRLKP
ncbi:histidine phosphatase family protein [uncultured Enterovirga sp.]|uniref:histidine phosphatase family protein n=1 Tax=uncultured Enterovirga sp. TaxID=2026352 RepID=UPI0035CBD89B